MNSERLKAKGPASEYCILVDEVVFRGHIG